MSKKIGWITLAIALIGVVLAVSALVGGNQSAVPLQGERGLTGPMGPMGPMGPAGRDGKDGKDAPVLFGAAGDIVTNVVNFVKGAKLGDTTVTTVSKTLEAGSNQVVLYRNQTGRDVWADYGDVTIKSGETASSSIKTYIISTSTSAVGTWADFGTIALRKDSLINGMNFATSSTASTTSNINATVLSRGNGAVLIPDGSYLIGYLQQNIDTINGCRGAVGLCEAATSTRRGANPVFTVKLRF